MHPISTSGSGTATKKNEGQNEDDTGAQSFGEPRASSEICAFCFVDCLLLPIAIE